MIFNIGVFDQWPSLPANYALKRQKLKYMLRYISSMKFIKAN
jgi:hypothetical protein